MTWATEVSKVDKNILKNMKLQLLVAVVSVDRFNISQFEMAGKVPVLFLDVLACYERQLVTRCLKGDWTKHAGSYFHVSKQRLSLGTLHYCKVLGII
jgi:hypothetical protein